MPWSLSTGDGCLAKAPKSALLDLLALYAEPVEHNPANAAFIVDAMAMLQSLASTATTFGNWPSLFLKF